MNGYLKSNIKEPPVFPFTPRSASELYEVYRIGLITRHICQNGRVDQMTWLQERGNRWIKNSKPRPRIDFNKRERTERWIEPDNSGNERAIQVPEKKIWWPWGLRFGVKKFGGHELISLPMSCGWGDNPFLTGGEAMAMFSMESLMELSDFSIEYARQLFNFFLESELKSSGFFMRSRGALSPWPARHTNASTDENVGLMVGILFYYKAQQKLGNTHELNRIKSFVKRWADNLGKHGFWILPSSEDFFSSQSEPDYSYGRGYIFAHVFKIFFKYITGVETTGLWDTDEKNFYLGVEDFLGLGEQIILDWTEDNLSGTVVGEIPEIVSSLIGLIEGTPAYNKRKNWLERQVREIPLIFEALSIEHAPVDSLYFFLTVLETFVPLGRWPYEDSADFENFLDSLEPPISPAARGLIMEQFDDLRDKIRASADENYFNYHMISLATIVALEIYRETDPSGESCKRIKEAAIKAYNALMGTSGNPRQGSQNSLFGTISTYCRVGKTPEPIAIAAMNNLVNIGLWQHDLPLGFLQSLNELYYDETILNDDNLDNKGDDDTINNKGRGLTDEVKGELPQDWHDIYKSWKLPFNYNPRNQWGTCTTWTQKDGDHVLSGVLTRPPSGELPPHPILQRGPRSYGILIKELFRINNESNGKSVDMKFEGCGLGLLFPRILASYWNLLSTPKLEYDDKYPTLPYRGALPYDHPKFHFFKPPRERNEHYQRKLIRLRQKKRWVKFPPLNTPLGDEFTYWDQNSQGNILNPTFLAFRGSRIHKYSDELPNGLIGIMGTSEFFVHTPNIRGWQWYVEISESRRTLEEIPPDYWDPRSYDVKKKGYCKLAVKVHYPAHDWTVNFSALSTNNTQYYGPKGKIFLDSLIGRPSDTYLSLQWGWKNGSLRSYPVIKQKGWEGTRLKNVLKSCQYPIPYTKKSILVNDELGSELIKKFRLYDTWDNNRIAKNGVTSSFLFYRIKVKPNYLSIGNEKTCIASTINSYLVRYNKINFPRKFRYILNPHSGTIHDIKKSSHNGLEEMAECYNILLLPINPNLDLKNLTIDEIRSMMANIILNGEATISSDVNDLPSQLCRKDKVAIKDDPSYYPSDPDEENLFRQFFPNHIRLLPYKRLKKYLIDHPNRLKKYNEKNKRDLHLCSYCFK